MKTSFLKNDCVELWTEDGIIFQYFRPEIRLINIDMARKIVEDRLPLFNGLPRPLFIDTNNVRFMDSKAREYFASGESIQFIRASAFLLHNPAAFVGLKFFLNFNKPKVRTGIFTDKEKALQWLGQFKEVTT